MAGHSLTDDDGPFLGLGVSYFTALWRCRNDRPRLESDLAFLSRQGFNYYRMLSMVGWYSAWEGREIAPVSFNNRAGTRIEAWPDYWRQLRELIDIAYDRHGLRTQITIFADAQLMPEKAARIEHMRQILTEVLPGREHKIMLLEVANEAWQNGFPGEQGVRDLKEFARYLADRSKIPVAITSNHEGSFEQTYRDTAADLATWHFSRDRGTDDGWKPVYDSWDLGERPGFPPVISNEPIGPGSSVAAESDLIKLVSAAAFAYIAKLPAYVFHSSAGVFGRARFDETPGIDRFPPLLKLLPADLPNWRRNDGREPASVFTVYSRGEPNRFWPETGSRNGCVRMPGARKGERFVCLPIGIRPQGVELQARRDLECEVYDPLTGIKLSSARLKQGEKLKLPPERGALLLMGRIIASKAPASPFLRESLWPDPSYYDTGAPPTFNGESGGRPQ